MKNKFQSSTLNEDKPKVVINAEAMEKIKYWVAISNIEISGLGKCSFDKESNSFLVSDVWLLEQENSATTTDIDAAASAKLMFETKDVEGDLNFWWHSHVNMGVFWSGTDTSTIKEFGDNGYCLATVFNKKGEMKSAFYQGANGFLPSVFLNDLPTTEYRQANEELIKKCKEEYEAKCKTKSYGGNFRSGKSVTNLNGRNLNTIVNQGFGDESYYDYDDSDYPLVGTTNYNDGYMTIHELSEFLGFETSINYYQYTRIMKGTSSYSTLSLVKPVVDGPMNLRDEGALLETNNTLVYCKDRKHYITYSAYLEEQYDGTCLLTSPQFNDKNWKNLCGLYTLIFGKVPLVVDDIVDFFIDMMEISFTDFSLVATEKLRKEYAEKYNELLDLHKGRRDAAV